MSASNDNNNPPPDGSSNNPGYFPPPSTRPDPSQSSQSSAQPPILGQPEAAAASRRRPVPESLLPTDNRAPTPSSIDTPTPPATPSRRPGSLAGFRQPSIRLRRAAPSVSAYSENPDVEHGGALPPPSSSLNNRGVSGRRRSGSEPLPPPSSSAGGTQLGSIPAANRSANALNLTPMPTVVEEQPAPRSRAQRLFTRSRTRRDEPPSDGIASSDYAEGGVRSEQEQIDMDNHIVDVLDAVDPEVSTLTTLTNMQNSLFVPNLGRFISRRPVYTLTPTPTRQPPPPPPVEQIPPPGGETSESPSDLDLEPETSDRPSLGRLSTITSTMSVSRYAVLPHGKRLAGWSPGEKDELNDHVRHMLHSRRSRVRRSFRGFMQYVSKPLGFFITLYAVLITLFGLAWVLFLIGWINVGGRKDYLVNVIDNVLVALFAIMGDGLAPFRAWDTYNMAFIVHLHRKSWKLRKKQHMPKLENKNDLPKTKEEEADDEAIKEGQIIVLNDKDQASLEKHEARYSRSHTFYKPHETATHFAFPIAYIIAIQILLDLHSCLQISLGATTWGISYKVRPFALTTVILCCSITCNITAAIVITIGDHKTRKKDVLERMFRQELTEEAIHHLEKRRKKEDKRNKTLDAGDDTWDTPDIPLSKVDTEVRPPPQVVEVVRTDSSADLLELKRKEAERSGVVDTVMHAAEKIAEGIEGEDFETANEKEKDGSKLGVFMSRKSVSGEGASK